MVKLPADFTLKFCDTLCHQFVTRPIDDEQVVEVGWLEVNQNPPNFPCSRQQNKQDPRQRLRKQGTAQGK